MPSTESDLSQKQTGTCPLCSAPLAPGGASCTKCDWVPGYAERGAARFNPRDLIAALMSLVPGLGHIYKGHKKIGTLYLIGTGLALFAGIVAGTYTAGFAMLLIPLYWAWVMLLAYLIEDRSVPPKQLDQ